MRILLIANRSIQNDAIKQLLLSEDGWEIHYLTHDQIENHKDGDSLPKSALSLVDLTTCPHKPDNYVEKIANKKLADCLITLHNFNSKTLRESLIDAGADHCLSIDTDTKQFLKTIREFSSTNDHD